MNEYQAMLIDRAKQREIERQLRHAELVHEATQIEKAQPLRLRFHFLHLSGLLRFVQPPQRSLITLKTIGRCFIAFSLRGGTGKALRQRLLRG